MRTTVVLVPTRNQSWNVGSVARLVTSKGIFVVVKRTMQMLVVRERGLRTIPKTKVDAIAWWIDYDAITHVCKDHCWFKTFEPVEDGFVLYMGDEHFAPVHGKRSVALEFSSRKTVTLFNVLYVPKLRKNLVSGPVLNKCGYKQVYESDKYILSKSGVFVGFGYYNNGMFMLNLNKVHDDSDSVYMSSSTVVNSSLWHARLGHVHDKRMLEMSKDDLIPAIDENLEKYTTCMDYGYEGGRKHLKNLEFDQRVGFSRNAMDVEDVLTHPEENVVAQLLTDEEIIESVIGINKDDIDEEDDESSTMEPSSRENEAI
ncbi:zinc finger, CCHC-type containing protein [Tanacetum coccineum]